MKKGRKNVLPPVCFSRASSKARAVRLALGLVHRQVIGHVDPEVPVKTILREGIMRKATEAKGVIATRQGCQENVIAVPDRGARAARVTEDPRGGGRERE